MKFAKNMKLALVGAACVGLLGLQPQPASAHGQPVGLLPSRNSLCTKSASRPVINKSNPMCIQAYEGPEGDQPGYDPFESNQAEASTPMDVAVEWDKDGNPIRYERTVGPYIDGVIPAGEICGAGRAKYANFNTPSDQWPYSAHEPGATVNVAYTAWAPHPGQVDIYVPNDDVDPTKTALGWENLKPEPISTFSTDTVTGNSEEYGAGTYEGSVTLPDTVANAEGRGTLVFVWRRSDSPEVFYNCSDYKLEAGAKGELHNVLGDGGGSAPSDSPSEPTLESTTSTTSPNSTTTTTDPNTTNPDTTDPDSVEYGTADPDTAVAGDETVTGLDELLQGMKGKTLTEKLLAVVIFFLQNT